MPIDLTAACKLVATDLHTIQHLADRRDAGARMRGYRMAPTDHDVATLLTCHARIADAMLLLPTGFDSSFCTALHYPQIVSIGGVSALTYHSLCGELGRRYLARWGHLPRLPMEAVAEVDRAEVFGPTTLVVATETAHEVCAVVSVDRVTPDGFDPGAVLANLEREGLALLSAARPPADAVGAEREDVDNRSLPLSKTELARRFLQKRNARPREAEALLRRHGLQRAADGSNFWTVSLAALSPAERERISKPLRP